MILHLVSYADWEAAPRDKPFVPGVYARDGFVHCASDDETLLRVANGFYKSQSGDFVVLHIDETRLSSPLKWEAPAHPAALQAIKSVAAVPANTLPADLSDAHIAAYTAITRPALAAPISANTEPPTMPPVSVGTSPAALFPHIYGPLNRDAIIGMRKLLRGADNAFVGFAPGIESTSQPIASQPIASQPIASQPMANQPATDPFNPLGLKRPSQLADELLDATDGVSDALKRLKDRTEARLAKLDEKIKKL